MSEPVRIGPHNDRVREARELLQTRGRREAGRFLFEGPTLLDEAIQSGLQPLELFVTESVYENNAAVRALAASVPVAIVDERTLRKVSDLETPTGLVAVAAMRRVPLAQVLGIGGLTLVLADVGDPGNAGTLLRSAEAFGASGVVFGSLAVDPYHPKVVRGAMGTLFRLPVAVATADDYAAAAQAAGVRSIGLSSGGSALRGLDFAGNVAVIVGHERRGLGAWEDGCDFLAAIPMAGVTESLNAAVAGSIALYEAAERRLSER